MAHEVTGGEGGSAKPLGPRWFSLLALPLIAILPILIFAIATTVYLTREQQRSLEREIVYVARHTIQASDALLRDRMAALERLGYLIGEGEAERASYQARHLLLTRPDWQAIRIERVDGQVLVTEARPGWRTRPLPRADAPGRSSVVVVAEGEASPFLLLQVWASGAADEEFVLTAALDLAPFSEVLAGQADPSWTVAVLDPQRVIAGRSRAPEDFVGHRATPSLVEQIQGAAENFFYALNQEGQRVYTAFSTSRDTGWTSAVGAPAHLIEGPLWRAQLAWSGGGLAAVAFAALLAWLLARNMLDRQAAERRAMQLEAERQSEARLTDIATHFPGLIYRRVQQPDGRIRYPYVSQGIDVLLGEGSAERLNVATPLEELARHYIVPEDRPAAREAIQRSVERLEPFQIEVRFRRPDDTIGWMRSMASTRRAPDGSIIWDGVALDVTALKLAEEALKAHTRVLQTVNRVSTQIASELDRDKLVQLVLDAGRDVVKAEFGAFFYNLIDDKGESYTLYALSGARYEDFAQFPMPRNTAIFGPTFRGEGIVRLADVTEDPRYGRNPPHSGMPKGHLPVRSYLAAPVISRTGEVLGGLFFGHPRADVFDEAAEQALAGIAAQAAVALENAHLFKAAEDEIAHRKQVEREQRMLLAELNHRVKNTLAVVLSIAQHTARSTGSVERFAEVYYGRIMALANAHSLLTAGNWQATTLRALVMSALKPYADQGEDTITVTGPGISVRPKQALALSLVFHELATNASKYGALSAAGGAVEVEWSPAEDGMLRLVWRERPPHRVAKPAAEGFGSRLIILNIERELGGSIERTFLPDGFVAEMRLPWVRDSGTLGAAPDKEQGDFAGPAHQPRLAPEGLEDDA